MPLLLQVHVYLIRNGPVLALVGAHRLEFVGVLAESFRCLSEVDFYVWNVANLVCCQDPKNALLADWLELSAFELQQVCVHSACVITGEPFSEQRNNCLDVAAY